MKTQPSCSPLSNHFINDWQWSNTDKSEAVFISGKNDSVAHFHTVWSNGTAAIRGTRPVNQHPKKCYWEILLKDRVFGTSMMIGLTTRSARLHCDSFINLIGEDQFGWGLSHKGLIWHNGQWRVYTKPFRENRSTVIGCMYDGQNGTLTYYKDGECLGVAFTGLDQVKYKLYPTVCSTAAKTEFVLISQRREYIDLQDRCRDVIRRKYRLENNWHHLQLPKTIVSYLKMEDEPGEIIQDHKWPSDKLLPVEFQRAKIPMPDF